MYDMQLRKPVVCDASKVSLYKKITTICLLAREDRNSSHSDRSFTQINTAQEAITIIDQPSLLRKIN